MTSLTSPESHTRPTIGRPFQVVSKFEPAGDQPAAITALKQGLQDGLRSQVLLGVTGSGKTYTLAKAIEAVQRPALVLAPNRTLAAQLYSEFRGFFPRNAVEYFVSYYDYYQPEAYMPASDTYIEKDSTVNEHIEQMRLSATKALLERRDVIVVCSVSAIYGLGDPNSYLRMMLHLERGTLTDPRAIMRRLAELQYKRNDVEFRRGTYRARGDVVDVFPADSEREALRIELFDEEVEKLSWFDPLTGEILNEVPRATVYPSTHYATPREVIEQAIGTIGEELEERLQWFKQTNKLVEAQRLEQRTRYDLEMLEELGFCSGVENYSRHFSGQEEGEPPPTLFDYAPSDAIVVADESHVSLPQLRAMYRGDRSRKETLVNFGFRLESALDNRPLRFEEWDERPFQRIFVSATPGAREHEVADATVELVVRPTGLTDPEVEVRPVSHQVEDLMSECRKCARLRQRVLVTTLTKRMSEDLTDFLLEHGIRVRYLHSDVDTVERVEILRDLRRGTFDVLVGINLLREGLDLPEVALVAVLDADKEGFLRSTTSLIQTVGRAARNLEGRAIFYADTVTGSMERAMDEMKRRRKRQVAFNKANGISPKSIVKDVKDIIEGATGEYRANTRKKDRKGGGSGPQNLRDLIRQDGEEQEWYNWDAKKLIQQIAVLEKKMMKHAKDLEFEEAASMRDQVHAMRERLRLV